MYSQTEPLPPVSGSALADAAEGVEKELAGALLAARQDRTYDAAVVDIVAGYCQRFSALGLAPEITLKRLKSVIDATIDGDRRVLADRTVTRCIEAIYSS